MIFGRPLRVTVRPVLWDHCLFCLSVTLVYCGQMAGWIKMPLGTQVGLSPLDIVLGGTQLPHRKGHSSPPPLFGPCLLWQWSWMDQDAIWHGGRPRPRRHCVRWTPNCPLPHFLAHVYCGQMVTRLSNCRALVSECMRTLLLSVSVSLVLFFWLVQVTQKRTFVDNKSNDAACLQCLCSASTHGECMQIMTVVLLHCCQDC